MHSCECIKKAARECSNKCTCNVSFGPVCLGSECELSADVNVTNGAANVSISKVFRQGSCCCTYLSTMLQYGIASIISHWKRTVYRICLSISRSSSTICACALRGVRLIYRMWYIIADCGSKYNTWSIPSASRRRSRRWRVSVRATRQVSS